MSLYIDLSEFFVHPITTGIQRISGELCKYAPPGMLIPVRLGPNGYIAFDPKLIRIIADYFQNGSAAGAADIQQLTDFKHGTPVHVGIADRVLVPEVFDNPQRLAFFRHMSDGALQSFRFIVFDMLPLTMPQYFWAGAGIHEYFRLLRRASYCGFISEDTRQDYYCRTKRTHATGGVVLPLGCDALGQRPSAPLLNRPLSFSIVSTIEPRKNHKLILEAFEPLLCSIPGLTLSFIGRMGWVNPQFAQKVQALADNPKSGFRFFSAPNDSDVRKHIEQSRATFYLSSGEGYGLPPVESLWVGTPVIASNTSPSLKPLGSNGIHIVDPLDITTTRNAILAFVNNDYANQKAVEAFNLQLPTWRLFSQEVLRWLATSRTSSSIGSTWPG